MTGPFRCAVFAGVCAIAAGCGDDSSRPGGDASTGEGGLVISWRSDPDAWPVDLGTGVTLSRASFVFDNVRVVGDAAPGDPRTRASSFELLWEGTTTPGVLAFPDAPGGVYSQLSLLIDGHVAGPSIEWRGNARVNNADVPYVVIDDGPFPATFVIDETLQPPAVTTVSLQFGFAHVLSGIDFTLVPNDGGTLVLDAGDPQLTVFRTRLREAIAIVD